MSYYNRYHLEACLQIVYDSSLNLAKAAIDHGIYDVEALYTDLEIAAPVFHFRFREEQYEYNAIVRDWNSRLRSAIDNYLDSHNRERARATQRAREKEEEERHRREEERREEEDRRRRKEEKKRKEEEIRRRENEAIRRREEEDRRIKEKRKAQNKKNQEELDRIQEEWKAKHSAKPAPQSQLPADFIHCSSCGTDNAKSSKFCTHCGTQLMMSCPSCGELIRVGSKFCCFCGTKL